MRALISIQFAVPAGHQRGDYAQLCGNGGSGSVDYDNPLDDTQLELFPDGAGIFGFGHAPFGHFRFGHGHSMRTAGFGHLPFGHFPFGHGTAIVKAQYEVSECGRYRFGIACFDKLGNSQTGTPGEVTCEVHIAPDKPDGLIKNSYDKDTDILVLDVA